MSDNPLHVAAQLHYLRVLRENGELDNFDGTGLFERVCKAAFAMMFTVYRGEGGQQSLFEDVPDKVYKIDGNEDRGRDPIIGVTDAKSADKAEFSSEGIEDKHSPYLERVYQHADGIYSGFRVAHTFVVFDITGHQEIDFYREMRDKVYEKKSLETTMVVWKADALAYAYGLYLMADVANEITLSIKSFTEALWPFFDSPRFKEPDMADLRKMDRRAWKQEEYDPKYAQCEDLIVVTLDMVQTRFEELIQDEQQVDTEYILKPYFFA